MHTINWWHEPLHSLKKYEIYGFEYARYANAFMIFHKLLVHHNLCRSRRKAWSTHWPLYIISLSSTSKAGLHRHLKSLPIPCTNSSSTFIDKMATMLRGIYSTDAVSRLLYQTRWQYNVYATLIMCYYLVVRGMRYDTIWEKGSHLVTRSIPVWLEVHDN